MAVDQSEIEAPVIEAPAPVAPPRAPRGRAAAAPPPPAAPALPDFDTVLAHLNAHLSKDDPEYAAKVDKLKAHNVVAGVAGSMAQTLAEKQRETDANIARADARRAQEEELLRLAEEDPEAFAAKFRTEKEAERARAQIETLKFDTLKEQAAAIGRHYREMPEFVAEPVTHEEMTALTRAVQGKAPDESLGIYNRTMGTFLARRIARPLADAETNARLEEEREAAVAQANAARLRTGAAPSVGIAASAAANDEPDFRADYQGWLRWKADQKARRR